MNGADWAVIGIYALVIVGVGYFFGRSQHTVEDYYLARGKIAWWQSGLSTMATQLGAISFVSAPAFVALKADGGLKWLAYEFGVPLALIVVMAWILPTFHRMGVISIYEYLGTRFDEGTRTLVSLLFQIGRGLATAVSVLAGGLIVSTALGVSTITAIIAIGVVTIIYDVLGGIRGVIVSDVLQMIIIVLGILICASVALGLVGWDNAWHALAPERYQVLEFGRWGLTPEGTYGFWPMLLGGVFLYTSYYGCDQSQVQRELTVGSVANVRKSLLVNAFGRFPLVLLYCVMGVLVGAVVATPTFVADSAMSLGLSPEKVGSVLNRDPDRMVPMFILTYVPNGLIGFIFVAILSALMSSLDSALNSMSAVTMHDFYRPYWKRNGTERHYLLVSKALTFLWGVVCVGIAIAFAAAPDATRQTTIVLINAVGSLLYGPILAAFILGMGTHWANARGTKIGIASGVILNLILWQATTLSWLWWNVTGFAATCAIAAALSGNPKERIGSLKTSHGDNPNGWLLVYAGVGVYFLAIVMFCHWMGGGFES